MRIGIFTAALAVLAAVNSATHATELLLSGSTTVQSRILDPLKDDIKATTGIDITVEGIGSGNGVKRLAADEVPAAIVSSELGGILGKLGLPDDGTFQLHVLTEDEIVPIVNAGNPVSELSWAQLSDLYSGAIKNWSQVGGPDRKVQVVTSHPASATREVVWETVMRKAVDYARDAKIVYATKKEMVMVAEEPGGIGAVSVGFVQAYFDQAKRDSDAIEVKVVRSKKISRPLAIVTKGEPSPDIAKLIAFLKSDAAQKKFK